MKRIMIIILAGIFLLLSGCMKADDEGIGDESIYGSLTYSFDTMSFTSTSESDLLYLKGNTYFDFDYAYTALMQTSLSTDEQQAYEQFFTITDQMIDKGDFGYKEILNFSSSEFNDTSSNLDIPIGLEDIVMFNSFKLLVGEMLLLPNSSSIVISKFHYIELREDITLTNNKMDSLDYLQEKYNELYQISYQFFDFEQNTFDDLILRFEVQIDYVPTDEQLLLLETAYNIIDELTTE